MQRLLPYPCEWTSLAAETNVKETLVNIRFSGGVDDTHLVRESVQALVRGQDLARVRQLRHGERGFDRSAWREFCKPVSRAKARASAAALLVVNDTVQFDGGMGYTDEQRRRFLPRILTGEDIWAHGYSDVQRNILAKFILG